MFDAIWRIFVQLAPWLLLGMGIAGALHVWLPSNFVQRHLSGRWGVLKAVVLGVPLPLCSCGVIPAGLGLKKDGASDGASVGFLVSTPQTGVDSILVSASFLGWPFALFKVGSAFVTGLVAGVATDLGDSGARTVSPPEAKQRTVRDGLDHALQIVRTIWRWLVFGVLASAAIEVFVPPTFFAQLQSHGAAIPMLGALAISLPLYVCATASVPIAAAMVGAGLPAGAAIVFLMAGPATNLATIGAIYRGMGKRPTVVYLATIIVGSIGFGLTFDMLLEGVSALPAHHHEATPWWAVGSAGVLLALIAKFAVDDLRNLLPPPLGFRASPVEDAELELEITGLSCGGCVAKLEKALRSEEGVATAQVTLEPQRVKVQGTIGVAALKAAVEKTGFTVVAQA